MTGKNILILFLSILFIELSSCTNVTKADRQPVAKISLKGTYPKMYTDVPFTIFINVKTKGGKLDSTQLFLDNKLLKTFKNKEFSFHVKGFSLPGKHVVKAIMTKMGGTRGKTHLYFDILSNIKPENLTYQVINTYPHSTDHFTQGLEIHNGKFYESTGLKGKSGIFRFDINTGKILQSKMMNKKYFGEGITIFDGKIYQLTYKAKKGFIYDLKTFAVKDSFTYEPNEGWGITHNEQYLIKSDSSEFLRFLDPKTLNVEKTIAVYDQTGPVKLLNELEYYKGYIYANIWTTNIIVKIDPNTGKVLSKINLSGILSMMYKSEKEVDVLNGIAINPENGKIYVTGKLWPEIFEIKLIPQAQ